MVNEEKANCFKIYYRRAACLPSWFAPLTSSLLLCCCAVVLLLIVSFRSLNITTISGY